MGLLVDIPYAGGSSDYLYARIRHRRAQLLENPVLSGIGRADPRQNMLAEYRWVYGQLNHRLRRKFLPLFEYFELRLLVVALRYLGAEERTASDRELKLSLLHPNICCILQSSLPAVDVVARLEQLLSAEYPVFRGITEIYLRQGPGGLEQSLVGGYLQASVCAQSSSQIGQFLRYLLDMRNLLALHKHLRWQVAAEPPHLQGGNIAADIYQRIWRDKDPAALLELLKKFAGLSGRPELTNIENYLMQGLSIRLRRAGRDPLQLGLVIDYLWRCQLAARDRGVQLYVGRTVDETAATEVVG